MTKHTTKKLLFSALSACLALLVMTTAVLAWFIVAEVISRDTKIGSVTPNFNFAVAQYDYASDSFIDLSKRQSDGVYEMPIPVYNIWGGENKTQYYKFTISNTTKHPIYASIFYWINENYPVYGTNNRVNVVREDIMLFSTVLAGTTILSENAPETFSWGSLTAFSTVRNSSNPNYLAGEGNSGGVAAEFFVITDISLKPEGGSGGGDVIIFYLMVQYNPAELVYDKPIYWETIKQHPNSEIFVVCPVIFGGYATTAGITAASAPQPEAEP